MENNWNWKKEARAEARRARNAYFETEECFREQIAIESRAEALLQKYPRVFIYLSFGSEVKTDGLIRKAWEAGNQVFIPRIGKNHEMVFHEHRPDSPLVRHSFGMLEPREDSPVGEAGEDSLMMIPGLLFDRKGGRLGYGGGFYDAYLTAHPGALKAGLGFSLQLRDQLPPAQEHDQTMDLIITGKEIIWIGKEQA